MLHSVDVAKTHEIMARFRPIAPKPAMPPQTPLHDVPSGLHQHQHHHHHQPCAMSAAAAAALQLRGRACRARKRGRPGLVPLPMAKRQKPFYPLLPSTATDAIATTTSAAHRHPPLVPNGTQTAAGVQFGLRVPGSGSSGLASGFSLAPCSAAISQKLAKSSGDHLTLSLLPCSPPEVKRDVPVEQDLLQKLQEPKVIAPTPVRPVASTITVLSITPDATAVPPSPIPPKPEVVEEEVESETLPAVVSDSRNRVRLANSAYKEMVGQPECPWLDSIGSDVHGMKVRLAMKPERPQRIAGAVRLDVAESAMPNSASGFSCQVKIEWACNGRKNYINAPCTVSRLYCESRDYLFTWRFHTNEAYVTYCKA